LNYVPYDDSNHHAIYVIKCRYFYKIGITKSMARRLSNMRSNNPYDMVPKFFVAGFSIKPGEITQTLVKTSYRWHVISSRRRSRRQTPAQPAKLWGYSGQSGERSAEKDHGGYCGYSAQKGRYHSFQSRWLTSGIIFGEIKQNTPRMFPRTNREWFLGTAT